MIESKLVEGSALAANNTNFRGMKPDQQYSSHFGGARGDSGLFDSSKGSNKDSIWCTYCKKRWHNRDRCWKLHGKPSDAQNCSQITSRNWAMKGSQGVGQAIENKDRDFSLSDLDLPSSLSSYVTLKDSSVSKSLNESSVLIQVESGLCIPSPTTKDKQIQSATHPLQVYSRRKGPTAQPMPVLDFEPNPSADSVEVISNFESHENDVPVVDDEDLPIAIRKGVRECTRQLMYPLSHFVSYEKLSSSHKSFLTHLNIVTIPKTVFEALGSKE
ncbi:hypothetical protein LWI28_018377 [Acer negundo]|uniref:Uncharacterized protein n=1 Tax=Acer negundo TaxID=4023 RepID=A0AAD5JKC3_ACENE|nr:hypothetical protein LWI28_018377 [Acer negundo]